MIILGLSTDDILIAHNNHELANEVISAIANRSPISDLGVPKKLLSMRATYYIDGIILELLKRFNWD
jgi:hypothetical protein